MTKDGMTEIMRRLEAVWALTAEIIADAQRLLENKSALGDSDAARQLAVLDQRAAEMSEEELDFKS